MAWLQLLAEAGCFTDEQQAQAAEQVSAYMASLQTDLQAAGYYKGPIDGIYGPQTVAAVEQLQTDSGLPVTGLVDQATALALDKKVAAAGQQAATQQQNQTAALQTMLTLTGYWTGPIDGIWTPELTAALTRFQTALGVPPTGVVDAATMAAFQQALATAKAAANAPPPTTTGATADGRPRPRRHVRPCRSRRPWHRPPRRRRGDHRLDLTGPGTRRSGAGARVPLAWRCLRWVGDGHLPRRHGHADEG